MEKALKLAEACDALADALNPKDGGLPLWAVEAFLPGSSRLNSPRYVAAEMYRNKATALRAAVDREKEGDPWGDHKGTN